MRRLDERTAEAGGSAVDSSTLRALADVRRGRGRRSSWGCITAFPIPRSAKPFFVSSWRRTALRSIPGGAIRRRQESVAAVDACIHLAEIASVGRFDEDWAGCHAVNQSGFKGS